LAEIIRLKPARPCPICGKPSTQQFYPFDSARCQDIDLNRWLSGVYVVPTKEELAEEEADGAPPVSKEDDEE
jgi:endogenous inhibitor of DNA gyrase (YacG/DUF329 family)